MAVSLSNAISRSTQSAADVRIERTVVAGLAAVIVVLLPVAQRVGRTQGAVDLLINIGSQF